MLLLGSQILYMVPAAVTSLASAPTPVLLIIYPLHVPALLMLTSHLAPRPHSYFGTLNALSVFLALGIGESINALSGTGNASRTCRSRSTVIAHLVEVCVTWKGS